MSLRCRDEQQQLKCVASEDLQRGRKQRGGVSVAFCFLAKEHDGMKDDCHQSLLFSSAVAFPRMRGMNRECRVRPVGPLVHNPVLCWVIARGDTFHRAMYNSLPSFYFVRKDFFFFFTDKIRHPEKMEKKYFV